MKPLECFPPLKVARPRSRIRITRNHPAAQMLAARRQAQGLRGIWAELEHPFREPARIDPSPRLRRAVERLNVGIARIRLIEPADRGVESGGIQGLEILRHVDGLISELRQGDKRESKRTVGVLFCP